VVPIAALLDRFLSRFANSRYVETTGYGTIETSLLVNDAARLGIREYRRQVMDREICRANFDRGIGISWVIGLAAVLLPFSLYFFVSL